MQQKPLRSTNKPVQVADLLDAALESANKKDEALPVAWLHLGIDDESATWHWLSTTNPLPGDQGHRL